MSIDATANMFLNTLSTGSGLTSRIPTSVDLRRTLPAVDGNLEPLQRVPTPTNPTAGTTRTKLNVGGTNIPPARTATVQKSKAALLAQLSSEIATTGTKYHTAQRGLEVMQEKLGAIAGLVESLTTGEQSDTERKNIRGRIEAMVTEYNQMIDRTTANGQSLLDGSTGSVVTMKKLPDFDLSSTSGLQQTAETINQTSASLTTLLAQIPSAAATRLSSLRADFTKTFSEQMSASLANAIRPGEQGYSINAEAISSLIEREATRPLAAHYQLEANDVLVLTAR